MRRAPAYACSIWTIQATTRLCDKLLVRQKANPNLVQVGSDVRGLKEMSWHTPLNSWLTFNVDSREGTGTLTLMARNADSLVDIDRVSELIERDR
jgi:hypothetical protein